MTSRSLQRHSTPETRKHARFPLDVQALIRCKQASIIRQLSAKTKNISRGGVYFFSDVDLPIGSVFNIEMQLFSTSGQVACVLTGAGRIVRRDRFAPNRIGLGASFVRVQLRPIVATTQTST